MVPIYRKDEERGRCWKRRTGLRRKSARRWTIARDRRRARNSSTGNGAVFPSCSNWVRAIWRRATIVLKRRDTGVKETVPQDQAAARLRLCLIRCRRTCTRGPGSGCEDNRAGELASKRCESILREVTAEKGGGKFVMAHIKDDPACDARLKEFKATVRCIPLVDEYDGAGKCVVTGERAEQRVVVGEGGTSAHGAGGAEARGK